MKKVFDSPLWWCYRYDGRRKKFFCGMTQQEFEKAKEKHDKRECNKHNSTQETKTSEVKEILRFFSTIPYEYKGDGLDDFSMYQRPSSNGIGYVAICIGERGNNFYTENKFAVSILKRKYNEWKMRGK